MLDDALIELTVDGDMVTVDHHEALPEASAELLAHLVAAGAQGGTVSGVTTDQVAEAIADARKAAFALYQSNWSLAVLRFGAEIKGLEPGSEAMCALATEMYERGHADPEAHAPRKRGRPTLASGRWGRVGDRSRQHRTAGTKLAQHVARRGASEL